MRIATMVIVGLSSLSTHALGDVISLQEERHGTLYESNSGELANGLGQYFFAGVNNQTRIRRGLIAFDLAPLAGLDIQINAVTVRLHCSQGNPGANETSLHRTLSDWGVGSTDAPGGEGGGGAATPGSATWNYAFYDTTPWTNPGGDFAEAASASAIVSGPGWYEWSGEGLVSDLEAWISGNAGSYGWELIGNESTNGTAQRFDSILLGNAEFAPQLIVDYTEIPAPASTIALLLAGVRPRRRR